VFAADAAPIGANHEPSASPVTRKPPKAAHENAHAGASRGLHEKGERTFSCHFVPCAGRFSCRGHLTQTAGRDDAAATGEGRLVKAVPVKADGTTARPSSHGVAAASQAALAARQMRRVFVVRAGRRRVSAVSRA